MAKKCIWSYGLKYCCLEIVAEKSLFELYVLKCGRRWFWTLNKRFWWQIRKNHYTFSQLFSADGPTVDQLFFFNFVSSPLSHLSSLLYALPHVSKLTQLSPQKWKNGFSRLVTKNKNKKQKPKPIDKEGESEIRTWILECWVDSESSSISGWIFEHRPTTVKLSRRPWSSVEPWMLWGVDGDFGVQGFGHTVRE